MEAQATDSMTRRNGLDMELLQRTVGELREHPEAAAVTIRTRHRWDDRFAVDGYTDEVEEAGEVTARTFTFRTDWPTEVGGRNSGPAPRGTKAVGDTDVSRVRLADKSSPDSVVVAASDVVVLVWDFACSRAFRHSPLPRGTVACVARYRRRSVD